MHHCICLPKPTADIGQVEMLKSFATLALTLAALTLLISTLAAACASLLTQPSCPWPGAVMQCTSSALRTPMESTYCTQATAARHTNA